MIISPAVAAKNTQRTLMSRNTKFHSPYSYKTRFSCHVDIGIAVYLHTLYSNDTVSFWLSAFLNQYWITFQNMGMTFMLVMMVALFNNLNHPSTQAIALTQRNDLNQLIKGMGCQSGSVGFHGFLEIHQFFVSGSHTHQFCEWIWHTVQN